MSVNQILREREKTHGNFRVHATTSQMLKNVINDRSTNELTSSKREALEMIAHKMARILSGNSDTIDHWDDIAGYATLVANELRDNENEV